MLLAASLMFVAGSTLMNDADSVRLTLVPKGGMAKIGYYAPQRAVMSGEKPGSVTKVPASLASPMYGTLAVGKGTAFVLDEPDGKDATLYVDSNGNGDLTDDAPATWKGKESKPGDKGGKMYSGEAMVDIGEAGKPLAVNIAMYRFDKTDPARAALKSTLLYYRDYAYEGDVMLGGKKVRAVLSDENARGDFRVKAGASEGSGEDGPGSGVTLLLDVNGNGKFDSRGEAFDIAKPFNVGGTTWEVADMSRDGGEFKIVKSAKTVAEIPTPPDHSTGKMITAFEAKDTEGKAVKFPGDYSGKVVLLDFWATWCGPCMAEMPNVVAAYGKYHAAGFEILGISLDDETTVGRMPEVMKKAGMTWRQVADSKGWQAEIAQKYVVNSIPATFLVDGTTGKILGANLRGPALDKALEAALKDKK